MLIILPKDESHYQSFVNLNCVEKCWVGEEAPEGQAFLSGKCSEVSQTGSYLWEDDYYFKLKLDNGGVYVVYPRSAALRYLFKNLKVDDDLKICVYFGKLGLELTSLSDILSHTRVITTKVELAVDLS